jgi:hypothetical protein
LVELGEALVDMMQEAFDVHGSPGETANTGAKAAFEVVNVRSKETASVRSDLVDHTNTLSDYVLELIVVVLELLLL